MVILVRRATFEVGDWGPIDQYKKSVRCWSNGKFAAEVAAGIALAQSRWFWSINSEKGSWIYGGNENSFEAAKTAADAALWEWIEGENLKSR